MHKEPSIIRRALLLTAVNLLMRLASILFQSYLSGRIEASGLGLVQLVLTAGSFAVTLGLSGARVGAMYLAAQASGRGDADGVQRVMLGCLFYSLAVSSAVAAGLFLAAPTVCRYALRGADCVRALRILAVTLPFTCANLVLSGFFTATGRLPTLVAVNVLDRVLSLGVTFALLARSCLGPEDACEAIVLGGGAADLAATSVLFALFRASAQGRSLPDRSLMKGIRRVCVPLALGDYLRAGLSTLEQFLIPWGLSAAAGGTQALAAYGVISAMVFPILMFPASLLYALADLLVPELARMQAQDKKRQLGAQAEGCLQAGLLYASFVSGAVFVLARPLAMLLYHSEQAAHLLRVFAPMVLILYLDAVTDGMHKGLGQQAACVRYNTFTACLDVLLLFLLLPRIGLAGFVLTFALTHAVNFWLSIRRLFSVTALAPPLRVVPKTLLCPAAACALSLGAGAGREDLVVYAVRYAAVFFLTLYLTGIDMRGAAALLRGGRKIDFPREGV